MTATTASGDIVWLGDAGSADPAVVGGKAANLSRLAGDFTVPAGFCVTGLQPDDEVPARLLASAYEELAARCAVPDPEVAVRSSAADEDGASASFAGQHETVLNVTGHESLVSAVRDCLASFAADRATSYRWARGLPPHAPRCAVLVQRLIPADVAGVAFSMDPVSGDPKSIVVNASFGLGESIVGGTVTPDTYTVHAETLAITSREIGDKRVMTVPVPGGVDDVPVPRYLRAVTTLGDDQVRAVARATADLQRRMGAPVDVEFAWFRDELHLLQCRPISTRPENGSAS